MQCKVSRRLTDASSNSDTHIWVKLGPVILRERSIGCLFIQIASSDDLEELIFFSKELD